LEPFVDEIIRAIGKPLAKRVVNCSRPNLCPFYDDALHFHIHHNLPGEGVEGHLVGGLNWLNQ